MSRTKNHLSNVPKNCAWHTSKIIQTTNTSRVARRTKARAPAVVHRPKRDHRPAMQNVSHHHRPNLVPVALNKTLPSKHPPAILASVCHRPHQPKPTAANCTIHTISTVAIAATPPIPAHSKQKQWTLTHRAHTITIVVNNARRPHRIRRATRATTCKRSHHRPHHSPATVPLHRRCIDRSHQSATCHRPATRHVISTHAVTILWHTINAMSLTCCRICPVVIRPNTAWSSTPTPMVTTINKCTRLPSAWHRVPM